MLLVLLKSGLLYYIWEVTGGGYISVVVLALPTQVSQESRTHDMWEELEPQKLELAKHLCSDLLMASLYCHRCLP